MDNKDNKILVIALQKFIFNFELIEKNRVLKLDLNNETIKQLYQRFKDLNYLEDLKAETIKEKSKTAEVINKKEDNLNNEISKQLDVVFKEENLNIVNKEVELQKEIKIKKTRTKKV